MKPVDMATYRKGYQAGYKKALEDMLEHEERVMLFNREGDHFVETEQDQWVVESIWLRAALDHLEKDKSACN